LVDAFEYLLYIFLYYVGFSRNATAA
jgi:hypothetical protein